MSSDDAATGAYAEPLAVPVMMEAAEPSSPQATPPPVPTQAVRPSLDRMPPTAAPRPAAPPPPPPPSSSRNSIRFGAAGVFRGGSAPSGTTSGAQLTVRGSNFSVPGNDTPAPPAALTPPPLDGPATGQSAAVAGTDPCSAPPPPGLNLPAYQPWPPEEASSRVALDRLIGPRGSLSLYDTGELLREALNQSGYQQHAFYAVPGGFILVTETERTDPEGNGVNGIGRYQRPGEDRTGFLVSIRDLFLERPETHYRYLAIVVTDQPFCASQETLTLEEAAQRVRRGLTDLTQETRDIAFADRYRVTALIYEFVNDGVGYDLTMVAPGRIPPQDHLALSGLSETIPTVFAQANRASH